MEPLLQVLLAVSIIAVVAITLMGTWVANLQHENAELSRQLSQATTWWKTALVRAGRAEGLVKQIVKLLQERQR